MPPGDGLERTGAREDDPLGRHRDAEVGEAARQLQRRMLGIVGDDGEAALEPAQQLAGAGQQVPAAHQCAIEINEIAACGMHIGQQGELP